MPKGIPNRPITYACSICGVDKPKDELTVKRVQWMEMGFKGKNIRSRVVGWYCDNCRGDDPQFDMPAFVETPGFRESNVKG